RATTAFSCPSKTPPPSSWPATSPSACSTTSAASTATSRKCCASRWKRTSANRRRARFAAAGRSFSHQLEQRLRRRIGGRRVVDVQIELDQLDAWTDPVAQALEQRSIGLRPPERLAVAVDGGDATQRHEHRGRTLGGAGFLSNFLAEPVILLRGGAHE